jgi:hypothetical protein
MGWENLGNTFCARALDRHRKDAVTAGNDSEKSEVDVSTYTCAADGKSVLYFVIKELKYLSKAVVDALQQQQKRCWSGNIAHINSP